MGLYDKCRVGEQETAGHWHSGFVLRVAPCLSHSALFISFCSAHEQSMWQNKCVHVKRIHLDAHWCWTLDGCVLCSLQGHNSRRQSWIAVGTSLIHKEYFPFNFKVWGVSLYKISPQASSGVQLQKWLVKYRIFTSNLCRENGKYTQNGSIKRSFRQSKTILSKFFRALYWKYVIQRSFWNISTFLCWHLLSCYLPHQYVVIISTTEITDVLRRN